MEEPRLSELERAVLRVLREVRRAEGSGFVSVGSSDSWGEAVIFVLWKGAAIMGVWNGMIERAGAMAMAMFQNFTILI
jgi:hypothetical protein